MLGLSFFRFFCVLGCIMNSWYMSCFFCNLFLFKFLILILLGCSISFVEDSIAIIYAWCISFTKLIPKYVWINPFSIFQPTNLLLDAAKGLFIYERTIIDICLFSVLHSFIANPYLDFLGQVIAFSSLFAMFYVRLKVCKHCELISIVGLPIQLTL